MSCFAGQIDPEDIFRSLDRLEKKLAQRSYPAFVKPFKTEYAPLSADVDKEIRYPSEEEKQGHVTLARRLKFRLWEDVERIHALKILGERILRGLSRSNFVKNPRGLHILHMLCELN